jgi:hypothetical protein
LPSHHIILNQTPAELNSEIPITLPFADFTVGTSLIHKRKQFQSVDQRQVWQSIGNDSLALAQWSTAVAKWSNAMVPLDTISTGVPRCDSGRALFFVGGMYRQKKLVPPPSMDLLLLALCMLLAFRYALVALLRLCSWQHQKIAATKIPKATAAAMTRSKEVSESTNTDTSTSAGTMTVSLPLLQRRRTTEPALLPTAQQRQDWAPSVIDTASASVATKGKGKGVTSVDTAAPSSGLPLSAEVQSEDAETPKVPLQRLLRTYTNFPMDDLKTPRQSAAIAAVKSAQAGGIQTKQAASTRSKKRRGHKRFAFAFSRLFGCNSTKSIDVIESVPLAAEP